MLGALSNMVTSYLPTGVAIVLVAVVIKIMDDLLDEDAAESQIIALLGNVPLPYALAIFSIALALNWQVAFALFWSSYIVGMFSFPGQKLPTRLIALGEIIVGIIVMLWVVGLSTTLWAISVMLAVQLIDDYLDEHHDSIVGATNFALKFGSGECFILSLIAIYVGLIIHPLLTVFCYVTALIIGNATFAKVKGEKACLD